MRVVLGSNVRRLMSHIQTGAFLAALSACAVAKSADCPVPPVSTAAGATCVAESYVAKGVHAAWAMKFRAKELKGHWLVMFSPTDSNVRGGGGKLRIDKATGQVDVVELYR